MIIRDAAKEELAFIREQRLNAYLEHNQSITDDHWLRLKSAITSEADIQPGAQLIVAELDGKIAGSVVLLPPQTDAYQGLAAISDEPEIRMLAVTSEYRGQGVASALISECIRRSKAVGARAIGLHTGPFMTHAIRLYEKIGFRRVPEYDFQPAEGVTVLAFRLPFGEK